MFSLSRQGSAQNRRGVAAIEFAMVAPLFIIMMLGIISYASWFWTAHSVQSLASESARAAISGLNADERKLIAQNFVTAQAPDIGIKTNLITTAVQADTNIIRVNVSYDTTNNPLMNMAVIIPRPPAIIERTAVVRLGGY